MFFILPIIGVENNLITLSAIATSLFAGSFASTSAFYNHWRKDNIKLIDGLFLGVGCFLSASIIPKFVSELDPTILRYLIVSIIVLISIYLFFSMEKDQSSYKKLDKKHLFLFGLIFGGIASLSGFGGGIFYVPFLIYYFKGNLKLAVGTATIAAVMTMISSVISYLIINLNWNPMTYQVGYINLKAGIPLGIGSLIGAKLGVKLILNIPVPVFKKIFSVFLLLVMVKILEGM